MQHTLYVAVYCSFAAFLLAARIAAMFGPDRSRIVLALAAALGTAAVLLLSLFAPGVFFASDDYFHDVWTVYEAINKAASGLRSSADYFSPIGPVQDWIYGAAIALGPASAATLPLASTLAAILGIALAVAMLARRISLLGLCLTAFVLVATAASPRELDTLFTDLQQNYLAPYNRWAWALLIPVALRLATPSRGPDALGAVATGIAIAALILLKVTYGAAALGLLAVAAVLRTEPLRDIALAAIAVVLCIGIAELATGQVLPHYHDLAFVAGMETVGLRYKKFTRLLGEFTVMMLVSLFLLMLVDALSAQEEEAPPDRARPILLMLAVGGAGAVILMQNHYSTEAAVYAVLPLIAAEWTGLLRLSSAAREMPAWRHGPVGMLLVAAVAFVVLRTALVDTGTLAAQHLQLADEGTDPALADTALSALVVDPSYRESQVAACETLSCEHYIRLAAGLALLREAGVSGETPATVLTLYFSNPFPALLGMASPERAPTWFDYARSFSSSLHIPAETLFEGVDIVMIANREFNALMLERAYAEHLSAHYAPTLENPSWRLLRRVQAGSAQPAGSAGD